MAWIQTMLFNHAFLWLALSLLWHFAILICAVLATHKLWCIERYLQSKPNADQPGARYQGDRQKSSSSHAYHSHQEATQPGPPKQNPSQVSQKPERKIEDVPTEHAKYLPKV
jgi:pantothenate kinase